MISFEMSFYFDVFFQSKKYANIYIIKIHVFVRGT